MVKRFPRVGAILWKHEPGHIETVAYSSPESPMTNMAASVPQTTTALSDVIQIALFSLGGLLLSFAFMHGGADVVSALLKDVVLD